MLPICLTDTVTPDLDRALNYLLLWGLEGLELRSVGGQADRVPFVNEVKLKRRLAEHDMPVVSIVPGMFEGEAADRLTWLNELAAFEETLAFCKRIGCPLIVVSGFAPSEDAPLEQAAQALHKAGTLAAQQGVGLAVLNEHGMAHPTGTALGGLLRAVNHPAVGAAWSPAEALRSGEGPGEGIQALEGRIALVRFADGRGREAVWQDTLPGEVDWPAQFHQLRLQSFAGPISLEVRTRPASKEGLRAAATLMQLMRV